MNPAALLTSNLRTDESLFVFLDAAGQPEVPGRLAESAVEHQSLFEGEAADELTDVAPYLARAAADSPVIQWALKDGWGAGWSCYLAAESTLAELREHFRRFLLMNDEQGDEHLFRLWDPRVLRVYIETSTHDEAIEFFGPVRLFLMEGDRADTVWTFELTEYRVHHRIAPMPSAAARGTSATSPSTSSAA